MSSVYSVVKIILKRLSWGRAMKIDLPEDVAQELQEITRKHGIELDFLLRLMISRYKEAERGRDKPYPTLADLVENAEAAGLASA